MALGPKDPWDKVAIVLQPLGGLLTALAVAAVGVLGSQVLDRRQAAETNARLYSELMSRREEAESSLRKDMFVSIISSFLEPRSGDLDARVLNLELLAYNFHDSLNLKPLFADLARQIAASRDPRRDDWRLRVQRVAQETAAKQLFALEGHGQSFRRSVDLEALAAAGRAGVAVEPERVAVDGVACEVGLRVLSADPARRQLRLRLEVRETGDAPDARATFDVTDFDLPMIDNTRLANGLRCAVSLAAFSPVAADLTVVCFPGEYASLKDRPYYDEVIRQLQEAAGREAGRGGTG